MQFNFRIVPRTRHLLGRFSALVTMTNFTTERNINGCRILTNVNLNFLHKIKSTFNLFGYDGMIYVSAEPCELYCADEKDTIIVPWGKSAKDGTPCRVGTYDMCISGICRVIK